MKKIIIGALVCLLNCIGIDERKTENTNPPNLKFEKINAYFATPRDIRQSSASVWGCDDAAKKQLNYNNIFSAKGDYATYVKCNVSSNKNADLTDYLLAFGGIATFGIIPIRTHKTTTIDINVNYGRDEISRYNYENSTYIYWSWLLIPFGIYQSITQTNIGEDHFIFLKNTNTDIHNKIISYNKILDEKKAAKLEEDAKSKEQENIKLEAERKELEEKLKTVKTTKLQIGSAYCLEESYILGITYTTNEDILSKLIFAKVCFEVEDKPLAAKLIPYDKGVYVYVDSQKYYSSKKLLKVK